jgi:hypothetical protein
MSKAEIKARGMSDPIPIGKKITPGEVAESENNPVHDRNVDEGYTLEDRPYEPGMILPIYYKGHHLDSCIKTEYGWICTDTCRVESRGGHIYNQNHKKEVDKVIEVGRTIKKTRLFKYSWKVFQLCESRTFHEGRSFRQKDTRKVERLFHEGITKTKFGAKKAIIESIEQSLPFVDSVR